MTIGLAGLVIAVAGAFASAYFFGGKRWHDNTDAEKDAHRITRERLAAREATLVEKDHELERIREAVERVAEERERAVAALADVGGTNVVAMLEALTESIRAMTDTLHEIRSEINREET